MNLRPWDIVFVRVDERDPTGHPAVILSCHDLLDEKKILRINLVTGSKRPPAYAIRPHQVVLNGADGLEFQTMIDCSMVLVVRKENLIRLAGSVSFERRREISRKIRAFLCLG